MKSTFSIGLLMVVGAVIFAVSKYKIYKVEKEGEVVKMKIIKLPSYCGLTRSKYYMDVQYKDVVITKKIPTGYCNEHKIGELIEMKYLEGEDYGLFPNEKTSGEFLAISIVFGIGILAIILSFFEKKHRR